MDIKNLYNAADIAKKVRYIKGLLVELDTDKTTSPLLLAVDWFHSNNPATTDRVRQIFIAELQLLHTDLVKQAEKL